MIWKTVTEGGSSPKLTELASCILQSYLQKPISSCPFPVAAARHCQQGTYPSGKRHQVWVTPYIPSSRTWGCLLPHSIYPLLSILEMGRKATWILWFDPLQLFLLHATEAQQTGTTSGHLSDEQSPDSHCLRSCSFCVPLQKAVSSVLTRKIGKLPSLCQTNDKL